MSASLYLLSTAVVSAAEPDKHQSLSTFAKAQSAQRAARGIPNAPNANAVQVAPPSPYTLSSLDYNKPISVPLGWHFAHADNCGWFQTAAGDQWFFILPNGSPTVIIAANNTYVSEGIAPACAHGFGFWWHVIDQTTGAFDQIYGLNN